MKWLWSDIRCRWSDDIKRSQMICEIPLSAQQPSDNRWRHTCSLHISTFSALGVSHVMRYINLRYLLTYFWYNSLEDLVSALGTATYSDRYTTAVTVLNLTSSSSSSVYNIYNDLQLRVQNRIKTNSNQSNLLRRLTTGAPWCLEGYDGCYKTSRW